ncbi:ATP-binding protein [Aureimonas sp. AU40]|uniref:ATP-binding protein n=1 Tax=Aureimonas sp. AU40 TaxID=1637747 RepID=UPI0007864716|nr:ATP-binding protein [Aureimonas sp. AU40]
MEVSQIKELDTHAIVGGGKAQAFGMSDSAEFYTVLSDTLYRDKKLAVVREVICNAWDAHIMVEKTDVPVKITLTDEALVIEDFGPGIPPELIGPVYCVYGGTTKVKDERQTGGFGLGCKAPFAYSDHFTVMSCHAGIKTLWAISRGGSETDGKPDFRPMVQVPTKATGITVSIPIRDPADVEEFTKLIRRVVRNGGMLATLNDKPLDRFDYEGARKAGFCLVQNGHTVGLGESKVYVLYGTVLYPVMTSDQTVMHLVKELSNHVESWAVTVLMAPPNTVGVVPSREGLSFSELTTKTVTRLLNETIVKLKRHAAPVAKRTIIERAEKQKRRYALKLDVGGSMLSHGHGLLDDPKVIAERAVQGNLQVYLAGRNHTRWIFNTFAKTFRDDRRTFRRARTNRYGTGFDFNHEAYRHSSRLFRRMAAKLGMLDRLFACHTDAYANPRYLLTPFSNFKGSGEVEPLLVISPNQRDASKWIKDLKGPNSFSNDKRPVMVMVVHRATDELLTNILEVAESYKIDTELLDFPKRQKGRKVRPADKFTDLYSLKFRHSDSTWGEPSLEDPAFFVRFRGRDGSRVPYSVHEHLETLKELFPKVAVIMTAGQQAKVEKLGAKPLLLGIIQAFEKSSKSRDAQYAAMIASGDFVSGSARWDAAATRMRDLCKGSAEIAKILFPDRATASEKAQLSATLNTMLTEIKFDHVDQALLDKMTLALRKLRADANATFKHLVLKAHDVNERYGYLRMAGDFNPTNPADEQLVVEFVRHFERRRIKAEKEAAALAAAEAAKPAVQDGSNDNTPNSDALKEAA